MNYRDFINQLKNIPNPSRNTDGWTQILAAIQPEESIYEVFQLREFFKIRYLVPILTPAVIAVFFILNLHYFSALNTINISLFSSTEYIYTICQY